MIRDRGFQDVWRLALLTIAVIFASSLVFGLLPYTFGGEFSEIFWGEMTLIIPLIIGASGVNKHYGGGTDWIGIKGFSPLLIPFLVLLPMSAQYFASYMSLHVNIILQLLLGSPDQSSMIPETVSGYVYMILSLCVAAPILEELICRGIMMKMLERYGTAAQILVSGIIFAMLHVSAESIIALFFVGVLLGVVRKATGSIFPSMIMHCVNNGTSLALSILTENGMLSESASLAVVLTLFVLFPILICGFLHICDKHGCFNFGYVPPAKKGFSVCMVICIAICVVYNLTTIVMRASNGDITREYHEMFDNVQCFMLH